MKSITEMKMYIVSNDSCGCKAMKREFADVANVEVYHTDIRRFFSEHSEIDCLVSPANAFGVMTGGYDAALSNILGWDFQKKVQEYIKQHFYGEQPVGTSFIIDTDIEGVRLIHTPSMQYPSIIKDDLVVYHCMRSTLMCALENDVKVLVLPIFGAACGGVDSAVAAKYMKDAYDQICLRRWAQYDF